MTIQQAKQYATKNSWKYRLTAGHVRQSAIDNNDDYGFFFSIGSEVFKYVAHANDTVSTEKVISNKGAWLIENDHTLKID